MDHLVERGGDEPGKPDGIDLFGPGGFGSAQKFEKVNFSLAVLAALERKVNYMKFYRRQFSNNEMATL